MSSRFEKQIIMPRGPLGPTTLMGLDPEDLASVERWHRPEWQRFVTEIEAYKNRALEAARSAYLWQYEQAQKCPRCRAARTAFMLRAVKLRKYQRGILQLATGGTMLGASSADCTFTQSTIPNLFEFNIEPTNSFTHGRLFSDGDWYSNAATTSSWGGSDGTWQGGCAVADYDTRWNRTSGDVPSGGNTTGSDGVWTAGNISAAVSYHSTPIDVQIGVFSVQCRDGTTFTLLFTDGFNMQAEVETRN